MRCKNGLLAVAAAAGILIAAAATGGAMLATGKEYDGLDYEDDWKPVQEKARTLGTAADALWGMTGAAALTTILLAVFTDFEGAEKKAVGVEPTIGGLLVKGEF